MKNKKGSSLCILILCSLVCISGCSMQTKEQKKSDILTMKKSDTKRTQISVLVKYAYSIHEFEKTIESKFPDIDIVQVGNYTANTALAKEYEARLKNDDLTDIVMTWPLDVGKEYWKDRLIDLSGLSFTGKYNISMLDTIATEDSSLYYLPGPASIRGIIYNKTMFEKHGWKVPKNYTEFIRLCKKIEAAKIRPFQLSLGNKEVLDTAFIGFNYGNAYSKPSDTEWLDQYNKGIGNFNDHFADALATFEDLIKNGILKKEDLNLHYQDTQMNLFTGKIAMTEDSVLLTHSAKEVTGTTDEFALMPFFNKNPENDWARIYMVCYIGLNKHLQDRGNEEKYEKVMKVMEYISTPEGQAALQGENGAMLSSLKVTKVPQVKELNDMQKVLEQGRYGVFPALKRSEDAFQEGLTKLLKGQMTTSEVATYIDEQNRIQAEQQKTQTIGKATEDFSLIETGNYVTDVLKKTCKTDFALFLDNGKDGVYNGKGISAKFYKGNISDIDIARVFPDLKHGEKGELWSIKMTKENLIKTLEYAIPVDKLEGWFYYFSGLKVTFDPYAKPGKRIRSIEMADGKPLENGKVYTIAVMEDSVPTEYIMSCKKTGILIQDVLKQQIKKDKVITPAKDNRFIIQSK